MDILNIDVMTNNGKYFYKSLKYNYNSLFKFDLESMMSWLYESLPSLKTRDDVKLHLDFPNGEKYEVYISDLKKNYK